MTLVSAAATAAIAVSMVLFLAGFLRIAEVMGAGVPRRQDLAIGGAQLLGATAIWFFTLAVVGGLL